MQSSITLVAFLTFFTGALPLPQVEVQSLPEIARRIRSAQIGTETQRPVFTNENIGQAQAALSIVRASNPPETPTPAAESAQAETAATAAPARTEDEWRAAFAAARAAITGAEEGAQLTEQELQTLNFRLLTESGLFNREGQLLALDYREESRVRNQPREHCVGQRRSYGPDRGVATIRRPAGLGPAMTARGRTLQGRALGSSGFRREERSGAMVSHRDRRTTKSVTRTPLRPTGYGGIGPSATLPLLFDGGHRLRRGASHTAQWHS